VLLLCFAWSATCFAATYAVRGFFELLVVRGLAGLSGGSLAVSFAMVMDCAGPEGRPGVIGFKGALVGAIVTCGPMLTSLCLWFGFARRLIFLLASAFCVSGCCAGACMLMESLPAEKRRRFTMAAPSLGGLRSSIVDDWSGVGVGLVCAWFARLCYVFSTWGLYATYSFLIRDNFGWSDYEFGMIVGVAGVTQGLLELFFYPAVHARVGEYWVCVIGLVVMSASFVFIPVPAPAVHLAANFAFQVGQSLGQPGLLNLTALLAPSEKHMGFTQGVSNSFKSMASVLGPLAAGTLYSEGSPQAFVLGGGVAMLGALVVSVAAWFAKPISEREKLLTP